MKRPVVVLAAMALIIAMGSFVHAAPCDKANAETAKADGAGCAKKAEAAVAKADGAGCAKDAKDCCAKKDAAGCAKDAAAVAKADGAGCTKGAGAGCPKAAQTAQIAQADTKPAEAADGQQK